MYTNLLKTILFVSFLLDKDIKVCYNIYRNKEHRAKPKTKRRITMKDFETSAAALYDGGWRATDKEELIEEYDLTEEEASKICELLEEYEKNDD
jgi:hypothetical protein